jgi:hypothetical protein
VFGQENAVGSVCAAGVVTTLAAQYLTSVDDGNGFSGRRAFQGIFAMMLVCLSGVGLALSGSRGATFAVLSYLVVLLFLSGVKGLLIMAAIGGCLAASISAGLGSDLERLSLPHRLNALYNEFAQTSHISDLLTFKEIGTRAELSLVGLEVFLENPIFGTGLGTFSAHHPAFSYTHSTIPELLASGGAACTLPLAAAVAIVVLRASNMARASEPYASWGRQALAIQAFLFVQGLSIPILASRSHTILVAFLLSFAMLSVKRVQPLRSDRTNLP